MTGLPSSDSASSEIDLTDNEVRILHEEHLLFPTPATNKRKISVALLTPPASNASSGASSSPSLSVRFNSYNLDLDRTFLIPRYTDSVAALEFIGFTTTAASQIFKNFSAKSADHPDDLLEFACGHIAQLNRKEVNNMSIADALSMVGMHSKIQAVFLDPQFQQVRETQTLHFWVKDTITVSWLTLTRLQQRLKTYAKDSESRKKQKRVRISASTFTPPVQVGPIAMLSQESNSETFPAVHTLVDTAPEALPRHVVLYKGKPAEDMSGGWIKEDGSLNMPAIASATRGDFNSSEEAYCFYPEHETAELYRKWAQEHCPCSETWTIRIQLSDIFVSSLPRASLWWGQDFKDFNTYKSVDLMVGHVARSPKLPRMKRENVQNELTEDKLVWIGGGTSKATQWVFRHRTGQALAQEAKEKIHIEVFAPMIQQGAEGGKGEEGIA